MEEDIYITDLIDADVLQKIQDSFAGITNIATLTVDVNGKMVTRGSNLADFCMKYTRNSSEGSRRCEECYRRGAQQAFLEGRAISFVCHNGLVDFAAPIHANGKFIGAVIGGQILTDEPDILKIRDKAEELGIDPLRYVQAIQKVNIVDRDSIDKAIHFLYILSNVLSELAYSNRRAMESGQEMQKAMQMKSDFLANMSHEIRTPMNAVIGMAEMALREELTPAARNYINQIKSSGRTLLAIINDILDFSKIESGKMDIIPVEYEPINIVNDVTNIIMTRIGEKNVELIMNVNPNIPRKLYGDDIRIKQIIVNLANNAVKFTSSGEVVLTIDYEKKNEDDDFLELKVSVQDTGIGIKPADVDKLFNSFQQLDSKRNRNIEGTGLGLAISKQLLNLMDGDIFVKSEYGKGSTFSFVIPQKIVDYNPCVSLKRDIDRVTIGLMENVFMKNEMEILMDKFSIDYRSISRPSELYTMLKYKPEYVFVEHSCYSSVVEKFTREHPEIKIVLLINYKETIQSNLPNLMIVRKPLCALNLAAIYNHEELNGYSSSADEECEFIAPDANILIVDDNSINLTVAEGLLEPLKMNIDTVISGKDAISKISCKRYDIIFMDHMMPELDGVETTHIIRRFYENYADVPIIALTANAVEGVKEMFLKEGMNDFVAKPIELRNIVAKIRRWLPKDKIKNITDKDKVNTASKEVEIPEDLAGIEGIDVKYAMKLVGNEKLYREVLRNYYDVIDKKIDIIKEAMENDIERYTVEVHALKSASRQIGALELSDKAAYLEKCGKEKNIFEISEKTDEMLELYKKYEEILRPYCVEEEPVNVEDKEEIDNEHLAMLFDEMEEAIDNLDMDAMEEVAGKLKGYRFEEGEAGLLDRFIEATNSIDGDECENIISEWKELRGI